MVIEATHPFRGGVHLQRGYDLNSLNIVTELPLPSVVRISLKQNIGLAAQPIVSIGERVLKYQPIAEGNGLVSAPVHASTSGEVIAIERPQGSEESDDATEIIIEPDRRDEAAQTSRVTRTDHEGVLKAIQAAGVVGLGGAGFPTHIKIEEGTKAPVDILLINAVECDPLAFSDAHLLNTSGAKVLSGANTVAELVRPGKIVIAISESNIDLCRRIEEQISAEHDNGAMTCDVECAAVPERYPAGSEKQLIKIVADREVPVNRLPIHVGVLVLNVATVTAVAESVDDGIPLIERYLTVTPIADADSNSPQYAPTVVRARVGTPIRHVLESLNVLTGSHQEVVVGGAMMGEIVENLDRGVSKTTAVISLAERPNRTKVTGECIRCGDCVPVCPVGLQPQKLYDCSRLEDYDGIQDFHLFDCIECGCCSYVCPAELPLVHHYREAKRAVDLLDDRQRSAASASQRYASHVSRQLLPVAEQTQTQLADPSSLTSVRINEEIENAIRRRLSKSSLERDVDN